MEFLLLNVLCMIKMFPFKLGTREEEQVGLPYLFSEIEKKCSNFGKNALIAVIYVLNFSFKEQFLRVSRGNKHFSRAGHFFFVL